MLRHVARLKLDPSNAEDFIAGEWQFSVPLELQTIPISVESIGTAVPSWRAELGLPAFQAELRSDKIKVVVSSEKEALVRFLSLSFPPSFSCDVY